MNAPHTVPSDPGTEWSKDATFAIDAAPDDEPLYRMLYEACDGTATDERGVWRIATASSTGSP
jgi:hypothetical protein